MLALSIADPGRRQAITFPFCYYLPSRADWGSSEPGLPSVVWGARDLLLLSAEARAFSGIAKKKDGETEYNQSRRRGVRALGETPADAD